MNVGISSVNLEIQDNSVLEGIVLRWLLSTMQTWEIQNTVKRENKI